jgi:hypothetical protein
VGKPTLSNVDPQIAPAQAPIVVVPALKPVAKPWFERSFVIWATALLEEDQVVAATFCVVESANVPTAVNCWTEPVDREGVTGATLSDIRFDGARVEGAYNSAALVADCPWYPPAISTSPDGKRAATW